MVHSPSFLISLGRTRMLLLALSNRSVKKRSPSGWSGVTRRSYLLFMMVREDMEPIARFIGLMKPLTSFRFGMLYHQTRQTDPFVQLYPMGDQGDLICPCRRPPCSFLLRIRGDPTHPFGAPRPSSRGRGHSLAVPRAATRGEGCVNGTERRDWGYTRTKGQDN